MSTLKNFRVGCCRNSMVCPASIAVLLFAFMAVQLQTWATDATAASAAHKVQVNDPAVAAQLLANGAQWIAGYDGYALLQVNTAQAELTDSQAPAGAEPRDDYNLILLNAARLDTSKPEVQALSKAAGQFTGARLHLVQFAGPVQPAWREELLGTGARIVCYIPHNAYLVYGDAKAIGAVQSLAARASYLQWEGDYLPGYKIDPAAQALAAKAVSTPDATNPQFAIQLVADPQANPATLKLIEQLKLAPVSKQHYVLDYLNVIVALPPASLNTLASQPDVLSIQPYIEREKYDERQDQIVAGNLAGAVPSSPGYLAWLQGKGFTQGQFSSSGLVVDVSDSGIDNGTANPNHSGLHVSGMTANPSRVAYSRVEGRGSQIAGCDGHGNLNAHVIGGYNDLTGFPFTDTAGYHYGLGVCPFVKVGASVIFAPSFAFPDYTTLQSHAYRDGARVSNNSWGANVRGAYDIDAQEYDALVRDAQPDNSPVPSPGNQETVIVFANGNSGPSRVTVGSPASAKNVISVGAAENVQPIGEPDWCLDFDVDADSADDMASYSSRGPCADGRHKPDIVAPGTRVIGGVAQDTNPGPMGTAFPCYNGFGICGSIEDGLFFPTNQEFYTISTGTSHAAPAVAGGCALIRQYFVNKFGGPPSAAMTKAYLVNSARYMTGAGASGSLWSDNQGMGEMNLGMAFDDAKRFLVDQAQNEIFTASGQVRTYTGRVTDPTKPFRVTIAWTDAPGSTAGAAYNNNLDLIVTVGGATYRGNVFTGAFSTTGGSADPRNNVESVFLPAGLASGNFTITVIGTDINSDGVPNNASPIDQDFALVAYNAQPGPPTITSFGPTTLMVLQGQPATFTVTATSRESISYQWRKNGANISGATSNVFTIPVTVVGDSALYSVVASDINGSSTSADAPLTVVPTVPLDVALNTTNLIWTSTSNTPWFGQTLLAHDALSSGQSYFVPAGQQSVLQTTITGPGTLSFWWKIISPTNAARCSFADYSATYTNTVQITGPVDWTNQTVLLPAGPQTLAWTYANVSNPVTRTNGAYLDQISFAAGPTVPFIVTQPAGQQVIAASQVTFVVQASGTPLLAYQWYFNGVAIPGATNGSFAIASAGAVDSGRYTVQVTNAYGSVLSQEAVLQVVPVVVVGANDYGQTSVSMLATNAIGIGAGAWHSLIARGDGTVYAWGDNASGQCSVPPNLTNAMAVAGGGAHSLALRSDGTVIGWGDNSYGQAIAPSGLSNVTAIAAGNWHSLALRSDGTVVAWGDNSFGQLNVPGGLNSVIAISAAGDHALALKSDGSVVAWGANTDPQWSFAGQSIVPWGLSSAVDVAAGEFHSLSASANGTVSGWGYNALGETLPPLAASNTVALAAGNQFSIAIKADGTAVAWGNNWNGQCDLPPGMSNVIAIAAGDSHTVIMLGRRSDPPRFGTLARRGTQFQVWVQTIAGRNYALESSTSVAPGSWSTVSWFRGNGAMELFVDPSASTPRRFYRIRQW